MHKAWKPVPWKVNQMGSFKRENVTCLGSGRVFVHLWAQRWQLQQPASHARILVLPSLWGEIKKQQAQKEHSCCKNDCTGQSRLNKDCWLSKQGRNAGFKKCRDKVQFIKVSCVCLGLLNGSIGRVSSAFPSKPSQRTRVATSCN